MNDSSSVSSSSYSASNSSNNSNSNSLNRSLFANFNLSKAAAMAADNTGGPASNTNNNNNNSGEFRRSTLLTSYNVGLDLHVENFFKTPFSSTIKRRAKSQMLYLGDDPNTPSDYNKLLIEDLLMLKKQLKEKDEIILKLTDIRNKLESEIQELSASLFEEAYSMVNTARADQAQSEKRLREANGKIEVLQAEVTALKELVITSTPNKHFLSKSTSHSRQASLNQQTIAANLVHQQQLNDSPPSTSSAQQQQPSLPTVASTPALASLSTASLNNSASTNSCQTAPTLATSSSANPSTSFFSKSHKRTPSDVQQSSKTSLIDKFFSTHSSSPASQPTFVSQNMPQESSTWEIPEIDPIYYKEIEAWKESPSLDSSGSFMTRVYNEDILLNLTFPDKQISDDLLAAIKSNSVCIEDLTSSQFPQVCGLSNLQSVCQYKIKISELSDWIFISKLSRNRVISVCDFFTYLRYIKHGLVKCDFREMYWNIIDLRRKMLLSRLGL